MSGMKKYFKIKKFMKYSLKEYAVYVTLAAHTDKNNICKLTRAMISNLSGVSDLDTITKYTSKFEKDGLLVKKSGFKSNGKKYVEYQIVDQSLDYLTVTNKLFGGNPKLLGFMCLLAQNKYKNTNLIKMENAKLYRKMGISKSVFYIYIKLAEKEGYVTKISDGYKLNESVFPSLKSKELNIIQEKVESIMLMDSESRPKKMLLEYYNPLTGLFSNNVGNVLNFLDYCLSGVPKHTKVETKEKIPKIDYKF